MLLLKRPLRCSGFLNIKTWKTLLIFLMVLLSGTCGKLLCSQCTSGPRGYCATSAPEVTPCESTSDPSLVNCMITKQRHNNGSMISFTRGCTMVRVGTGCVDHLDNTTLCYETCSLDGCNLATKLLTTFETLHLLYAVLLSFSLVSFIIK